MPHIDPIAQPADEREIEAFKAWAKYPVPDDYLAFLRKYNGGYLAGVRPGFYNKDNHRLASITTFMHISEVVDKCINKIFEKNFSFYTVKFETGNIQDDYFAPDHYIKIADGAEHEHVVINLKTGHVIGFTDDNREIETAEEFLEECSFLADNFDSFFSQIADDLPDWV
ncbi:SMI1/KNR4 family protein [Pseudovibrio sp. Ad26]|uniref:SMI1/KNR4 family protein n=1 Tax=Pseudovibrio sp. Ad26 TaxID=989410 RepID=UPI0007AE45B4|nr:SMI1/KNR4 family protein [Pseudovibrio sp. Ad26]KZL10633.1 SMI1 / KNR4 family protein [Pseudovibrio sp. Ad26]